MSDLFHDMVEDIKRQLEDRGAASGTRSVPPSDANLKKVKQDGLKSSVSRESRSMQQVINFSSPSFAGH